MIIGLLGAAGSGKSTVAKYLVEKYGAKQYTFAAPLKEIVRRAFDLRDAQVYGSQVDKETVDPRYNVSPRWLMTHIGTEGIRAVFGPDFWWKMCLQKIDEEKPALAVIDDVRFINEAYGIMLGGKPPHMNHIWRLPSLMNLSQADQNHQSEAEWTKAPFTFALQLQAGGLEELYRVVDQTAALCGLVPSEGHGTLLEQ